MGNPRFELKSRRLLPAVLISLLFINAIGANVEVEAATFGIAQGGSCVDQGKIVGTVSNALICVKSGNKYRFAKFNLKTGNVPKNIVRTWSRNFCIASPGMSRTQIRNVMGLPNQIFTSSSSNQDSWNGYNVDVTAFYDINDIAVQLQDSTGTSGLACEEVRTNTNGSVIGGTPMKTAKCNQGGPCVVGDIGPGGGVVFYVATSAQWWGTYIEAAPSNWSTSSIGDFRAKWGCAGQSVAAARNWMIGYGKSNTTAIVSSCSEVGIAARRADDAVINGKSDWFLPSKDELNLMYQNRAALGGIRVDGDNQAYWSSTETDGWSAVGQLFTRDSAIPGNYSGQQFDSVPKVDRMYYFRPIRYGN